MFQCGGGTIASAADSHTGASNADLIALEPHNDIAFSIRQSRCARPVSDPSRHAQPDWIGPGGGSESEPTRRHWQMMQHSASSSADDDMSGEGYHTHTPPADGEPADDGTPLKLFVCL